MTKKLEDLLNLPDSKEIIKQAEFQEAEQTKHEMANVVETFRDIEEFDKIAAFSNLLKERKLVGLSELIVLVTEITNPNTSFKKVKELGDILLSKNYNENSVEQQFRIYGLMFKEKRFSSEFENNDVYEWKIISSKKLQDVLDYTFIHDDLLKIG